MNKEETNALQLLTGKSHLDDLSVEELEQLATDHPYFSAAQLLFSKKLQQENHPDLQQQLYKTALYFPDEQWLRYLLLQTKKDSSENKELSSGKEEINNEKQIAALENNETVKVETDLTTENFYEHPEIEANSLSKSEKNGIDDSVNIISAEAENLITLPDENKLPSLAEIHDEPEEAPLDEEEIAQQTEPLPIDESNQKIANLLSEQAQEFHKAVKPETPIQIETEPFHTVDYFASQGIKLDEKKEDTGFDKKVHKFTDWLRQMKRINPHPSDLGTDAEEESYIANIAASSNQTKEIITESMAEVLIKQNKREKAVEVYEKLSLLYPLKNAYFAAKIQQLKQ